MATPRSRATGTGVTKLPSTDNGGVGETLGENREEKCTTSVLLRVTGELLHGAPRENVFNTHLEFG